MPKSRRRARSLNTQESFGFGAVAEKVCAHALIVDHPRNRLVIPLAGLVLMPKLPVGHGEEEKIACVAALAKPDRFLQVGDCLGEVSGYVLDGAQRVPNACVSG